MMKQTARTKLTAKSTSGVAKKDIPFQKKILEESHPKPAQATLTDLSEEEKSKLNRLIEKLYELSSQYEALNKTLESEREQHKQETEQIYEKINGQLLIVEDKMKIKDENITSLTAKVTTLGAVTILYQKKLKSIIDDIIPGYNKKSAKQDQLIASLQNEHESLQLISKNDKHMISMMEKELEEKKEELRIAKNEAIPKLEALLKQEIEKSQKKESIIQELQMKNRFYHTEIQHLQKKIQDLNEMILQQSEQREADDFSQSRHRSHHSRKLSSSNRSKKQKFRELSDSDEEEAEEEDDEEEERSRDSNSVGIADVKTPKYEKYYRKKSSSSSNHYHRSASSSRSVSPILGASSSTQVNPKPSSVSSKEANDPHKSSNDAAEYSLMFQSTTSEEIRQYLQGKHLNESAEGAEERDEDDGDSEDDEESKTADYDVMFDTSDGNIATEALESPVTRSAKKKKKEEIKAKKETSHSLDQIDWMKSMKPSTYFPFKQSQSSRATPSAPIERKTNPAAASATTTITEPVVQSSTSERKRRPSDIFFKNETEDSFQIAANKRPHFASSSVNDASLSFDQSLNLSSFHVSDENTSPSTTKTQTPRAISTVASDPAEDDEEEIEISEIYERLTRSSEKKKEKDQKEPSAMTIEEEEVLRAYEEKKARLAESGNITGASSFQSSYSKRQEGALVASERSMPPLTASWRGKIDEGSSFLSNPSSASPFESKAQDKDKSEGEKRKQYSLLQSLRVSEVKKVQENLGTAASFSSLSKESLSKSKPSDEVQLNSKLGEASSSSSSQKRSRAIQKNPVQDLSLLKTEALSSNPDSNGNDNSKKPLIKKKSSQSIKTSKSMDSGEFKRNPTEPAASKQSDIKTKTASTPKLLKKKPASVMKSEEKSEVVLTAAKTPLKRKESNSSLKEQKQAKHVSSITTVSNTKKKSPKVDSIYNASLFDLLNEI